ncbi:MAG TPA: hypothetical protein V6D33_05580 [Cyanophyceae cyanobacterium]
MLSPTTVPPSTDKRTTIVALKPNKSCVPTVLIQLKRYAKDLCSPGELAAAVGNWDAELNPQNSQQQLRDAFGGSQSDHRLSQSQQQIKDRDKVIAQLQQKLIEVAAIAQSHGVQIDLELSDKGFALCSSKKSN